MSEPSRERIIPVNDISVRYQLEGPDDAPVVMFSNGLATSMAMWDEQARYFSRRWRVLRYDTRGHGETTASPPPYTIDQLALDVIGLMDCLNIARVNYVGLSLGGMIGQRLGAHYPKRIASIVLCDTTFRSNRRMWDDRIAALKAEGVEPQVQPAIDRWFSPPFVAANLAVISKLRRMILATSIEGYLGCAVAIRDMQVEQDSKRIVAPALIMVGSDDRSTPLEDSQALHAAIRGSQLVVLKRAAHMPNVERASQFNEILEKFLDKHGGD